MRSLRVGIAVTLLAVGLHAETHLGGTLNKTTLETSGNPYIIEEDVTVPADQHVTVKAGCVFLFKPFTGFQVHGRITAEGSQGNPIVFTSINDQEYNPQSTQPGNPFDWNGILITPESQNAAFKNFVLRYSVYGIKAQTPNITIQNGKFRQNGQFHFTINDKIQYVQDDFYYSYGVNDQPSGDTEKKEKPKLVKKAPGGGQESKGKLVFRWGCFGVGVAGIGGAALFGILTGVASGEISDLDARQQTANAYDPAVYNMKRDELGASFTSRSAATIILGTLGVLGATGFGLSFVF